MSTLHTSGIRSEETKPEQRPAQAPPAPAPSKRDQPVFVPGPQRRELPAEVPGKCPVGPCRFDNLTMPRIK